MSLIRLLQIQDVNWPRHLEPKFITTLKYISLHPATRHDVETTILKLSRFGQLENFHRKKGLRYFS